MEGQIEVVSTDQRELFQEGQMSVLVATNQNYDTQGLGKIKTEVCSFKSELCKSLETIEQKLDAQFTLTEEKIELLGKGQWEFVRKTDQLQAQIMEVNRKQR